MSLEQTVLFNREVHTWLDCYRSDLEFIFPHFRQTLTMPKRRMGKLYQQLSYMYVAWGQSFYKVLMKRSRVVLCRAAPFIVRIMKYWRDDLSFLQYKKRKKKNYSLPSRLDNTLDTYAANCTCSKQNTFTSAKSTRGNKSHVESFA